MTLAEHTDMIARWRGRSILTYPHDPARAHGHDPGLTSPGSSSTLTWSRHSILEQKA